MAKKEVDARMLEMFTCAIHDLELEIAAWLRATSERLANGVDVFDGLLIFVGSIAIRAWRYHA